MSPQSRRHALTLGLGALLAVLIVHVYMQPASAERQQAVREIRETRVISLAELERDSMNGSSLRVAGAGGASLAMMFPAPDTDPLPARERPDRFIAQERDAR